ncbi:hypothetical protein ZWY2020_040018 [Hordeum vulgare]|nr:hypothetical protein ZWY2020_040018 [Hordeum vulgare]
MLEEAALFSTNAVVAWLDRDRQSPPTRLWLRCAKVWAWRLEAHAEHVDQPHHARLCLEGLPLHASDDHAIAAAIGAGYSLDYVESASKLKTETKVVKLWAWTSCPTRVLRINWITLPARNGGEPRYGRRGLEHIVLIHLDIHEDSTCPYINFKRHRWLYNMVDGETNPRDHRERICRPYGGHRCRDDEDDNDMRRGGDRDRRGRAGARSRSKGWGNRLRRSLSRAPHQEACCEREPRLEDRDRGGLDGQRRSAIPTPVPPAPVAILQGSGSDNDVQTRATEMVTVGKPDGLAMIAATRGRNPVRQSSPTTARRRSLESLTPPASPPLFPTTVLPATPSSK